MTDHGENCLYASHDIARVITPRRMRWAGHAVRMGEEGVFKRYWLRGLKEGGRWEDLGVDGRLTLTWTLGTGIDGANGMQLAQDRAWWQIFLNTMNLRVP